MAAVKGDVNLSAMDIVPGEKMDEDVEEKKGNDVLACSSLSEEEQAAVLHSVLVNDGQLDEAYASKILSAPRVKDVKEYCEAAACNFAKVCARPQSATKLPPCAIVVTDLVADNKFVAVLEAMTAVKEERRLEIHVCGGYNKFSIAALQVLDRCFPTLKVLENTYLGVQTFDNEKDKLDDKLIVGMKPLSARLQELVQADFSQSVVRFYVYTLDWIRAIRDLEKTQQRLVAVSPKYTTISLTNNFTNTCADAVEMKDGMGKYIMDAFTNRNEKGQIGKQDESQAQSSFLMKHVTSGTRPDTLLHKGSLGMYINTLPNHAKVTGQAHLQNKTVFAPLFIKFIKDNMGDMCKLHDAETALQIPKLRKKLVEMSVGDKQWKLAYERATAMKPDFEPLLALGDAGFAVKLRRLLEMTTCPYAIPTTSLIHFAESTRGFMKQYECVAVVVKDKKFVEASGNAQKEVRDGVETHDDIIKKTFDIVVEVVTDFSKSVQPLLHV